MNEETAIRELYRRLIEGWNQRSAEIMAETFGDDGEMIGFDGTQIVGGSEILAHVGEVFAHHMTPPFVYKVRDVRFLRADVADLRAIVGMVPPGHTELASNLNAHQTLLAVKREGEWRIALFQNTPAQFHGRPELVERMTAELREML